MATCDMGTWDGMVTADTAGHGHGNMLVGLTRTVNRSPYTGATPISDADKSGSR